ncbi:hypothetical protein D3C77_562080 [compost metagenome]
MQFVEVQHQGFDDSFIGQALAQRFGQMLRQKAKLLFARWLQRGIETGAGAVYKPLHIGLGTERFLLL